jgi:uncharacterized protein Yka (UPF0111/DUF47 family)
MSIKSASSVLAAVFLISQWAHFNTAFCQTEQVERKKPDPVEVELSHRLNRVQYLFMIANNNIFGTNRFEAVKSQKAAFAELQKELEAFGDLLPQLSKLPQEKRLEKMREFLKQVEKLEHKLKNEILIPSQVETLDKAEFEHGLNLYKGNYANLFQFYYGDSLELTAEQKKQIEELADWKKEEMKKLAEEMKKKTEKIESEMKSKLGKLLTAEQRKKIESISGQKLQESGNEDKQPKE